MMSRYQGREQMHGTRIKCRDRQTTGVNAQFFVMQASETTHGDQITIRQSQQEDFVCVATQSKQAAVCFSKFKTETIAGRMGLQKQENNNEN